jgi:hypothetical protein
MRRAIRLFDNNLPEDNGEKARPIFIAMLHGSCSTASRIAETDRYAGDWRGMSSSDFPAMTLSATYRSCSIFPPYGRLVSAATRVLR